MPLQPLSHALLFEAPDVVTAFQVETGFSSAEALDIFRETKRWLWACAKRKDDEEKGLSVPSVLQITPELLLIDQMWHCFLRYPDQYRHFCENYLGHLVQHIPASVEDLEAFDHLRRTHPREALAQRQREIRPQLEYLYDLLGSEVLRNWYQKRSL